MEFLKYFFRGVEDGVPPLHPFGLGHVLAVLIAIVLLIITIRYKNKSDQKQKAFIRTIAWLMLGLQIMMNMWFFLSGSFTWESSLPLYCCRIVTYFFIADIFFDMPMLRRVSIYWGLMGGILALGFPDPYLYKFPHFTNFQFFAYHYLLLIAAIYFIVVRKIEITRRDLIYSLKFTFIYNLGVTLANVLIGTFVNKVNYGFLMRPPFFLLEVIPFRGPLYTLMVMTVYLLVVVLMHGVYLLIKKLDKRS